MIKLDREKKQQKIIIGIIAIIIVAGICYYAYTKGTISLSNDIEEETLDITEEESPETGTIKVHISGAVNNEGLVELEKDSRIADAIEKAGGVTEDACIEEVNLAYMLEDGMKIKIPTKEEVKTMKEKDNIEGAEENQSLVKSQENIQNNTNTKDQSNNQTQKGYQDQNQGQAQIQTNQGQVLTTKEINSTETAQKNSQNKIININTAMQSELENLPGIGESTAKKIINYRNENGKFKTKEDIKKVKGIGDAKYEKIKDLITI